MALDEQWSKSMTYRVNCDCYRWPIYTITWLNKRGGFDTYSFKLKTTRLITNEKKEWSRFLSRLAPNDSFSYQLGERGRSVYSSRSFETATCLTEWISEDQNKWLAEMYDSPEVYRIIDENGALNYYPVVVKPTSVEVRDVKDLHKKNISLTIEFTYAYEIVNQRG